MLLKLSDQGWISFVSRRSLKGHRQAIWQLYKRLEGAFASIEFQNLWSSFIIEDFVELLKLFLSPGATDGGDRNGLKFEKSGQFF